MLSNCNSVIQRVAPNKSAGPVTTSATPVHVLKAGRLIFLSNKKASAAKMMRMIHGEYSVIVLPASVRSAKGCNWSLRMKQGVTTARHRSGRSVESFRYSRGYADKVEKLLVSVSRRGVL